MAKTLWGDQNTQFFYALTPDAMLESLEKIGLEPTGRCLPLNSMENRVYTIECETAERGIHNVVAKFYRPGRWSKEQIQEEHDFLFDCTDAELPVIAPLSFEGKSLFPLSDENAIWMTIFPQQGGRTKDEFHQNDFEQLGRLLARLHNVGSTRKADHRLTLSPQSFGRENLEALKQSGHLPYHIESSYCSLVETLCNTIEPMFKNIPMQRIHGDCHKGNIIWQDDRAFLVDFDDMCVGPVVQDVWLLLTGRGMEKEQQKNWFLDGYESLREFPHDQWKLIEPLRSLRMIHFTAWISKRWDDPAFKTAFPFFADASFWESQSADLREQLSLIQSQP